MARDSNGIVQKLWNYCNVLRDDGMSYGDYVEQLTYLLFLKMADERSKPPYNQKSSIPKQYNWQSLLAKDGEKLFEHYRHLLEELAKKQNLLGLIFGKSQNKFQDPAKLRRVIVDLIDKENWSPAFCCQVSYRSVRYQVNRSHRGADRVRSLRDKVASALGLVIKPRGAVATASTKAVGSEDGVARLTYVNR